MDHGTGQVDSKLFRAIQRSGPPRSASRPPVDRPSPPADFPAPPGGPPLSASGTSGSTRGPPVPRETRALGADAQCQAVPTGRLHAGGQGPVSIFLCSPPRYPARLTLTPSGAGQGLETLCLASGASYSDKIFQPELLVSYISAATTASRPDLKSTLQDAGAMTRARYHA